MRPFIFLATSAFALCLSSELRAEELDSASTEALQKTQALMKNQGAIEDYAKANPDAAKALAKMKDITGNDPKKQAEINQISSDIFTQMVKDTGGDNTKISAKLQEGLRNPASFMEGLSPEQRASIQKMAAEIDSKNKTTATK